MASAKFINYEGGAMQQTVEAIYESGGFRLIDSADLQLFEGQKVRLIIEPPDQSATSPLDLAAQVYEGLSDSQIEEIERIALDRDDFFGERVQ
jgi:predicted DNA-binding antitoxin AbrB/MazE fold protein